MRPGLTVGKRVPVVRDGKVVGIVSRANLLRAFASMRDQSAPEGRPDDRTIRVEVLKTIDDAHLIRPYGLNVTVKDGNVDLWGMVGTAEEKRGAEESDRQSAGPAAHVHGYLGGRPDRRAGPARWAPMAEERTPPRGVNRRGSRAPKRSRKVQNSRPCLPGSACHYEKERKQILSFVR